MSIRHDSELRSESLEQQPKNGPALVQGPAPALGVIVEDVTGAPPPPDRHAHGNDADAQGRRLRPERP